MQTVRSGHRSLRTLLAAVLAAFVVSQSKGEEASSPLPGTKPLEMTGDIASELVAGVDRFLNRQIESAAVERAKRWDVETPSGVAWDALLKEKRGQLAKILGVVDPRPEPAGFELMGTTRVSARVFETDNIAVYRIRWPAVRGVHGEGLLLEPTQRAKASAVLLPGVAMTPELVAGVRGDARPCDQYARRLAEAGVRVVVPVLINRDTEFSTTVAGSKETGLTHREFLYRPAFELGRHLLGYETQKVLAAVAILHQDSSTGDQVPRIGLLGWGDGGLIASYAAALEPKVSAVVTGTSAGGADRLYRQPLDRNVFGLWRDFGDAELVSMILPRHVAMERGLVVSFLTPPGGQGGPVADRWIPSHTETFSNDLDRLCALSGRGPARQDRFQWMEGWSEENPPDEGAIYIPFRRDPLPTFAATLGLEIAEEDTSHPLPTQLADPADPLVDRDQMKRQFDEIELDTQLLLAESPYIRDAFWAKTKPARESRSPDAWSKATKEYRDYFRDEVIGHFDLPKRSPEPRSRLYRDEEKYISYEVVLDVFDDVIAYGLLLVPKGIVPGERRPVVVAQHGLEGRPQDLADSAVDNHSYNQFGCRLAERGFVVFAPQNLYIFTDRFRVLQRKLNPLGKTLFSVIVPQHEQIVDWLASLPFVDENRIAFYGLSYGGKSAMRIPALVEKYCLSICSADFNDWIWKNASTRSPYSYVASGEYEIFEFDLGMTFNYAEMAGLICPRPFMVERGHRDGVAPDDRVAAEFAKVRLLYADLKIPERTELEVFDGPHTIHGVGTFEFLHRHLNWPSPSEPVPLNK